MEYRPDTTELTDGASINFLPGHEGKERGLRSVDDINNGQEDWVQAWLEKVRELGAQAAYASMPDNRPVVVTSPEGRAIYNTGKRLEALRKDAIRRQYDDYDYGMAA